MATYQKAGFDNSLEFDPTSGIIKYGNYEFFADQVGAAPDVNEFTFADYKKSYQNNPEFFGDKTGTGDYAKLSDDELRKRFDTDVQSGFLSAAEPNRASALYGNQVSPYQRTEPAKQLGGIPSGISAPFRNIERIDGDTYKSTSYKIPGGLEFLNKLNAQAVQLSASAALGQVTDTSRPVPGNSRLGKPNYSRAATVLAGEQSPLGGAKTTLGS